MVVAQFRTEIFANFQGFMQKTNQEKIAVIGGAGFIGSHIVDRLIEKGNDVLVIDNLVSGSENNINKKAEFEHFDITEDWKKLTAIFEQYQISKVFHLAAEPYIPECYDFPEKFFQVNANGTLNVLLACQEAKIEKIVYYSTSEVYGTGKGLMDESFPISPQSTYAVSKLAGDRLAFTLFKEHQIPIIILRQFNCYGPRETHEYIIPEIISQLAESDKLKLGNIKAQRDFLYVEDAAEMVVELMEKGISGEVYNLGSGKTYAIDLIAYKIGILMGKQPIIEIDQKRLRSFDVSYLKCDNSKIFKVIESRPKTEIDEGLRNTINWFYQNGKKWGFEK